MATILLVDDELIWSDRCASHLRHHGYEVQFCSSIVTAKKYLCKNRQIDLIVTDLMMPPKGLRESRNQYASGISFAKELRVDGFTGPIIIFSLLPKHQLDELIHWELPTDTGVRGVSKSVGDPDGLREVIDEVLGRSSAAPKRSWLRRFFESLMLQPNFAGLGVDLKRLFGRKKNDT